MLDTNTFYYIYDNGLIDKINTSVNKGSIQLFATHIQLDEIQKSSDDVKKKAIRKAIENLRKNNSNMCSCCRYSEEVFKRRVYRL
jgi:hypothetical protein